MCISSLLICIYFQVLKNSQAFAQSLIKRYEEKYRNLRMCIYSMYLYVYLFIFPL